MPENSAQDDSWKPDQNFLSTILLQTKFSHRVNEILIMPDFQFHLGSFNAHWENKIHLTENQKTRKFAAWLVQEFEKQVTKAEREGRKPTRKQSSEKPNNRNVNDPWGEVQNYEPATGDVDTRGLL